MLAETADLLVRLNLQDNLSQGILRAKGSLSTFDRSFSNTQRSLSTTANNIKRGALIIGGTVAAGIAVAVREASKFEASLNTINTVAMVSEDQLAGIGDSMRTLARDTGTSLDDLSAGYYDLVSAGIAAADAQGVLEASNTLAIGGLATTAETVDLLTTAINSYGFEASQAGEIADYFAQSIGAGKVTASELAASFAQVAPLAAASGIEIQELAAGYAQLTAAGVPAAEASTQMRAAMIALQRPTGALKDLQEKLGVSFQEIAEEQGLQVAYQQMRDGAEKYGIELITLTGRQEGMLYALQVTGDKAETYEENLRKVNEATEDGGVAAAQAAERQKGLAYQWSRFKAIARDVAIMFGQKLLPGLAGVVEKVNDLITANYPKLERVAERVGEAFSSLFEGPKGTQIFQTLQDDLGGLLDELSRVDIKGAVQGALQFLGELPWGAIKDGLQITGQAVKLLIDSFNMLPPDLKKIIIGAIAINRVTGGLVTSLVRDLGGIALRSLTTINAASVTVIGRSVAGVGGGAPVVAGAARSTGSRVMGALTVAGSLFFAGISITELINTWNQVGADIKAASERTINTIQTVIPNQSFDESIKGLQGLIANNDAQSRDVLKSILMQTGSGRTETTEAFRQFATQLQQTAQTPEERARAAALLEQLRDQLAEKFVLTVPEGEALKVELDPLIQALRNPPPVTVAGVTTVHDPETQAAALRGISEAQQHTQRLVDGLDRSHDGIVSMKEAMAAQLGVTIEKLRGIDTNEQQVATRLGITVDELRAVKAASQRTADLVNTANARLLTIASNIRAVGNAANQRWQQSTKVRNLPPGLAGGGDTSPGESYIVGEGGKPELLHMGSRRGYVGPLDSGRRGPVPVQLTGRMPPISVTLSARDMTRALRKREFWARAR